MKSADLPLPSLTLPLSFSAALYIMPIIHQGPEPLEGPENILPEEVACYAGKATGFSATQAWVQVLAAVFPV